MDSLDITTPLTDGPFVWAADSTPVDIRQIPVIEQQLQVTTRILETGRVRPTKTVHEQGTIVTIPLQQEQYTLERMALNAYVDQMPTTGQEGEMTNYPVVKEVLVVQKRFLLSEEIRVTRQQTQTQQTQTVRLRRETLTIERTLLNPERPT